MANINAEIRKVSEVISQELTIPAYQRPYCWEDKNVRQLFDDVYDSFTQGKQAYRIGSVILHEEEKIRNIVDGQQRITTILLMLKGLNENNEKIENLKFKHLHSETTKYIKQNHYYIEKIIEELNDKKDEFQKYLLEHCEFVEIVVDDLTEAFQMFDSQNGTGKELETYNLLKAYHIRAMETDSQEEKVRCDKRWEDATRFKIMNKPL